MIECKSIKPAEDIYSKCVLRNVSLYTYEWKIINLSFIEALSKSIESPAFPVSPCKNYNLKMFLSCVESDNIKVKIHLLKECRITEEMRSRAANCPFTSKLKKYSLQLDFLDYSGNLVQCYKCLPYEFRLINTSQVYVWTKQESLSKFVRNDFLMIRAKLSIRFYSDIVEFDESCLNESTKLLRNDIKNIFNKQSSSSDIIFKVGSEYVPCHKPIVYSQYPCFSEISKNDDANDISTSCSLFSKLSISSAPSHFCSMITNNCEILNIPNESVDVFLSVLYFIYTKQVQLSETVEDFAVYEFAKKYGVRDLSMLLEPTEMKVYSQIKGQELNYTWYVKDFSSLGDTSFLIRSPEFKTEIDNEVISWCATLSCMNSKNVIFDLSRINYSKSGTYAINVHALFKVRLCNSDGTIHEERQLKFFFTSFTSKHHYSRFPEPMSPFSISPDFLYNDSLAVYFDLIVSYGELSSNINYCYPSEHPAVDLTSWINNFQRLFETETFSDFTLRVEDKTFRVHRAILSARSPTFAKMFEIDMVEKSSGYAQIEEVSYEVMKQALCYIYTCRIGDLSMSLAPDLYYVADKYELMDLKNKCSEFMIENVNTGNASEILIIAYLHCDDKLKAAAENLICSNAP